MSFRSAGRPLVFACVVLVVFAGTASAGSIEGTISLDDATDVNASVDTETPTSDATDESTTSASVDGTLATDSDAGTSVTVGASTNDSDGDSTLAVDTNASESDANGTVATSVNDPGATIEGDASVDGSDASASVDASTNDTAVAVSAVADLNGTATSLTASAGTASDDADGGSTPLQDDTGGGSYVAATTAPSGAAPPGGDGDGTSGGPAGPAAAGGVAVAGSALVARRGLSAVGTGATSPSSFHDALSAVVHWLRANVPRVVFPLRYSRRDDSDPLEHEVRADLYEAVETVPGVHLSRLDAQVEVSLSSVRHHLRILEEEALIESDRIRGKRRYFPANASNTELRAALSEPATAAVLRALAVAESATVSDLADRLGRDPSTVSHHLGRLEEAGLVERERTGPAVVSRLADGPRRVLAADDAADAIASAD